MPSLNVNMPKDLRDYVDHRTAKGGFGTPTEYVRHLIRQDKAAEAERKVEQLLLEGLASRKATGGVKGVFRRLQKRLDELERERRGGTQARRSVRRRA